LVSYFVDLFIYSSTHHVAAPTLWHHQPRGSTNLVAAATLQQHQPCNSTYLVAPPTL